MKRFVEKLVEEQLEKIRENFFEDDWKVHGFDGKTLSKLKLSKVVISKDIDGKNIFSLAFLGKGIFDGRKISIEIDIAVDRDGNQEAYDFWADGETYGVVNFDWGNFEIVGERKVDLEVEE